MRRVAGKFARQPRRPTTPTRSSQYQIPRVMKTVANARYDDVPPGRKDAPAGQFEGELQGVSHTSFLPHETSACKGLSPSGSLDLFDVIRQHRHDWLIPAPLTQDRCLAARFYRAEFGWVVHQLATPAVSCERTAGSAHLQVVGRDFPMLRRRGIADAKDQTQ